MKEEYHREKTFKGKDFSGSKRLEADFEACVFENCNFLEADFTLMDFIDCQFIDCNLSLAIVNGTLFQDTTFKECKAMGIRFENCNKFGLTVSFESCALDNSSFYEVKMPGTTFKNCQLKHVDFTKADLQSVNFEGSNLEAAVFEGTLLGKADFRAADNFAIDPERNSIREAKFLKENLSGLVLKYRLNLE